MDNTAGTQPAPTNVPVPWGSNSSPMENVQVMIGTYISTDIKGSITQLSFMIRYSGACDFKLVKQD